MSDKVREIVLAALSAARYGYEPDPRIAKAVLVGDRNLTVEQLKFDSLAWMEFCISVELQCGQEMTPAEIEGMHYVFEIEEWLRARI